MMHFFKYARDFFNRQLSPHKLVDDKREANLRKIFGKDLLDFKPPQFIDSWVANGHDSKNCYRVTLRLSPKLHVYQVFETMKGCVEWCCGGGKCPDKSITIDYENRKVSFVVKPKYGDAESLPDGAMKGVAK